MRTLRYALACLMSASAVFVSAQEATPTPGPCADPANEFVPWTTQDANCAVHDEVSITMDASYPQALAESSPFTKTVMLDYINQARTEFWANVGGFMSPEFGFRSFPWVLEITPEIIEHSPRIVTVLFNSYSYTGGAHGGTVTVSFTFDLENETVLTLEDIFAEGVDPYTLLSSIAREDLMVRLADFTDFVEPGTEPTPENFSTWALTPDTLVLYFGEYQVAPYAAGPQQVSIPLTDLANSLNPEFVCISATAC